MIPDYPFAYTDDAYGTLCSAARYLGPSLIVLAVAAVVLASMGRKIRAFRDATSNTLGRLDGELRALSDLFVPLDLDVHGLIQDEKARKLGDSTILGRLDVLAGRLDSIDPVSFVREGKIQKLKKEIQKLGDRIDAGDRQSVGFVHQLCDGLFNTLSAISPDAARFRPLVPGVEYKRGISMVVDTADGPVYDVLNSVHFADADDHEALLKTKVGKQLSWKSKGAGRMLVSNITTAAGQNEIRLRWVEPEAAAWQFEKAPAKAAAVRCDKPHGAPCSDCNTGQCFDAPARDADGCTGK